MGRIKTFGVVDERSLDQLKRCMEAGGADLRRPLLQAAPGRARRGDTIRVKRRLRPLGVAMAGRDVYDPYKD